MSNSVSVKKCDTLHELLFELRNRSLGSGITEYTIEWLSPRENKEYSSVNSESCEKGDSMKRARIDLGKVTEYRLLM